MKTKAILIIALLCAFAGTARAQWDGDGTSASPYLIKTTTDLVSLATRSTSHSLSGTYFRLENDLDMSGVEIGTIGINKQSICGKFDGNGHAIRNLTINSSNSQVGLFGFASTGFSVRNLILDGANITGGYYVGAIVGDYSGRITIENCLVVNSSVTVTAPNSLRGAAILGFWDSDATLGGNYYYNCSVTLSYGTTKTNNIGTGPGDKEGAVIASVTENVALPDAWVALGGNQFVSGGIYYNGIVYTDDSSAVTIGPATWDALQTALNNASQDANNPTVLTLAADITAGANDTYLRLQNSRHVILDLNGHTLSRGLSTPTSDGHVITVRNGSLTIRDGSTAQTGTITGGYDIGNYGCIAVGGSATLTIEGGTISGNRISNQGASAINCGGTIYMTGGTITDNWANIGREGYPASNTAMCGAIYFSSGSYFYMSGGNITGNRCGTTTAGSAGLGVHLSAGSVAVHLSGSSNISGNMQGTYDSSNDTWSDLTPSDILNCGRLGILIDGAINPAAPSRLILNSSTSGWKTTFTSGWSTYMGTAAPEDYFTLADNTLGIGIVGGEATIGTKRTITTDSGITASRSEAIAGEQITLGGAGATTTGGIISGTRYVVTYNDGEAHTDRYVPDGDGNATFTMPDADVTVGTESFSSVSYIDGNGDEQICSEYTLIDGSVTDFNTGGWYVVSGNVEMTYIQFSGGNINLILCDGCHLNCTHNGLDVNPGSLSIYAQSAGTGRLTASSDATDAGAIYADDFTLYGGIVNATNSDDGYGIYASNNVTINGGNVTANGSNTGIYANNSITLGWTKLSDTIYASEYISDRISVKAGQAFSNGEETLSGTIYDYDAGDTPSVLSKLNGKTLRPVASIQDAEKALTARQAAFAGQTRYWATFYHPTWSYRLPAGAQAFTMKNDHALYRVGDGTIVPAGCAVVIMADSADITLTVTDASATAESGNILHGTSEATAKASLFSGNQKVYVMGKSGNNFGFFEFSGATVPANKAYYVE